MHVPVAFVILPVFAFANAGLSLAGTTLQDVAEPVPLGIVLGLVIGKPLGVLLFVAAAIGAGLARLPNGVRWSHIAGAAFACGIGFTMSLFIAGLAFEHGSGDYFAGDRLGILLGSILSALAAAAVLYFALPRGPRD